MDMEEIEKLKAELALVKDVLGNLIFWLTKELGTNAQEQLIDRLNYDWSGDGEG